MIIAEAAPKNSNYFNNFFLEKIEPKEKFFHQTVPPEDPFLNDLLDFLCKVKIIVKKAHFRITEKSGCIEPGLTFGFTAQSV